MRLLPCSFGVLFVLNVAHAQLENPGEIAVAVSVAKPAASLRAKVKMKDGSTPLVGMFSTTPTLKKSVYVYSDGHTTADRRFPAILENALFYELPSTSASEYQVVTGGDAFALARVNSMRDRDVWEDGLMTMVLPAARAGASFQHAMVKGKFQGMTWPTTPTGSWRMRDRVLSSSMVAEPSHARRQPAK